MSLDIDSNSLKTGKCDYCNHQYNKNETFVIGINSKFFAKEFTQILQIYKKSDSKDAEPLLNHIRDDWPFFSPSLSDKQVYEIIQDNFGELPLDLNDNVIVKSYPKNSKGVNELWDEFIKDITNKNPFFPRNRAEIVDFFDKNLSNFKQDDITVFDKFYRARIYNEHKEIEFPEGLLAPSTKSAVAGRGNHNGISHLYVACDEQTAIKETRPRLLDTIYIGEFLPVKTLKLLNIDVFSSSVDNRYEYESLNPFEILSQNEKGDVKIGKSLKKFSDLYYIKKLFSIISKDLSKFVDIEKDNTNLYHPSQFFCDYAKSHGYDGVCYKSSMTNGVNVVIFNDDLVRLVNVEVKKVNDVSYKYINKQINFDSDVSRKNHYESLSIRDLFIQLSTRAECNDDKKINLAIKVIIDCDLIKSKCDYLDLLKLYRYNPDFRGSDWNQNVLAKYLESKNFIWESNPYKCEALINKLNKKGEKND
jgi:hypothetical protein